MKKIILLISSFFLIFLFFEIILRFLPVSDALKTQPVNKATCGSTFKNPDGKSSLMLEEKTELKAWRLIDKAGLRGKKIGRAMVSNKHPNFLINLGGATARDMEALGEYIRESVYRKYEVMLDWEVIRVGRNKLD